MKRVLILGANGMLGHRLFLELQKNVETFGTLRGSIDSKNPILQPYQNLIGGVDVDKMETVVRAIDRLQPEVVINSIGLIKQRSEVKMHQMIAVNAQFPWQLYEYLQNRNIRMITISTDCVFSGDRGSYKETDLPDARDVYGRSKALGEVTGARSLVLRTSILGRELSHFNSLFEWVLSHKKGEVVAGYRRAIFSGFPTLRIAKILKDIVLEVEQLEGLFHLSSEPISKFELLKKINERLNLGLVIEGKDEPKIDRSLSSEKLREQLSFSLPSRWDELIDDLLIDFDCYREIHEQRGSYVF